MGQFSTPASIADYMGKLAAFKGEYVRILDPGAGSGILSAALIDNLIDRGVKRIEIDLYENNHSIIPFLEAGEFIYLVPRSFSSGLYFSLFRKLRDRFVR